MYLCITSLFPSLYVSTRPNVEFRRWIFPQIDDKYENWSQKSRSFLSRNHLTVFTYANNFAFVDCDGIDEKAYAQLARTKSKYSCVLCRGEKQERMDSFHRKNRNKTTWNLYIVTHRYLLLIVSNVYIIILINILTNNLVARFGKVQSLLLKSLGFSLFCEVFRRRFRRGRWSSLYGETRALPSESASSIIRGKFCKRAWAPS